MSWPATPSYTSLPKTHLNGAADDPSQARAQIEAAIDRVNALSVALHDVIEEGNTGTLLTQGKLIAIRQLTGSGTYTPTAGTSFIEVEMIGAGGGGGALYGGSAGQYAASGSGGCGGYLRFIATDGFSSVSYSVGAKGVGGSGPGGETAGGNTVFGSFATAGGGNPAATAIPGTAYERYNGGSGGVATWGAVSGATLSESQSGKSGVEGIRLGVGYRSLVYEAQPFGRMGIIGAGGGGRTNGNSGASFGDIGGLDGQDGTIIVREYG